MTNQSLLDCLNVYERKVEEIRKLTLEFESENEIKKVNAFVIVRSFSRN